MTAYIQLLTTIVTYVRTNGHNHLWLSCTGVRRLVKITFAALNYNPTSCDWTITGEYTGREYRELLIPIDPRMC